MSQVQVSLEDHFQNSKFACDINEYLPLVFSPPLNGEKISTPMVMGGHITSNKINKNNNLEEEI